MLPPRARADGHLAHVHLRQSEQRAGLGHRDHRHRPRAAARHHATALERVEGEVDRVAAAAELAPDRERSVVRADHDAAVDLERLERCRHGRAGRRLGRLLVGPAEPARSRERRPLGRARVGLAPARAARRRLGLGRLRRVDDLAHRGTAVSASARSYTASITAAIACSMFPFWTTATPDFEAWSTMKSCRWRMSPNRSRYFSSARSPPRGGVADREVRRVEGLVLDRHDHVDEDDARRRLPHHPRHEVDALEDDRPPLVLGPVDRRLHAHENVSRLVDEADQQRVARLALGRRERLSGLEARVVHRGHELDGEECAHRLAEEVGRRDARDPEPMRDLARDRRLAGPGRPADENDDRRVELAQVLVAAQPADRDRGGLGPERLDRELRHPLERDGIGPAPAQVRLDPVGELVRGQRLEAGGDERARHHALRVGQAVVAAERQRLAPARLGHDTATPSRAAAASARSSPSTSPAVGTTSVSASTSAAAARGAPPRPRRRSQPP